MAVLCRHAVGMSSATHGVHALVDMGPSRPSSRFPKIRRPGFHLGRFGFSKSHVRIKNFKQQLRS